MYQFLLDHGREAAREIISHIHGDEIRAPECAMEMIGASNESMHQHEIISKYDHWRMFGLELHDEYAKIASSALIKTGMLDLTYRLSIGFDESKVAGLCSDLLSGAKSKEDVFVRRPTRVMAYALSKGYDDSTPDNLDSLVERNLAESLYFSIMLLLGAVEDPPIGPWNTEEQSAEQLAHLFELGWPSVERYLSEAIERVTSAETETERCEIGTIVEFDEEDLNLRITEVAKEKTQGAVDSFLSGLAAGFHDDDGGYVN